MQSWFNQLPLVATIILPTLILSFGFFISLRFGFFNSKKKDVNNKLLLRNLLEDFGLEVPIELQDEKSQIINPMKDS